MTPLIVICGCLLFLLPVLTLAVVMAVRDSDRRTIARLDLIMRQLREFTGREPMIPAPPVNVLAGPRPIADELESPLPGPPTDRAPRSVTLPSIR